MTATATALAQVPAPDASPVERARDVIAARSLTQAAAAIEIGISDAALSQWLRGRYPGDRAAMDRRVARWLEGERARVEIERHLPAAPAWVETSASTRVSAVLEYAQAASDMALIHGPAGCGKTMAASRFVESRAGCWLATMSTAARTIGPCLERIAAAVGMTDVPSRSWRIEGALADLLGRARGILIVDEAQHLDFRSLDAVRALHDAAGIGIALLGTEGLYSRLGGGSLGAQIWSRIGRRVRLGAPTRDDVHALLEGFGLPGAARRELWGMVKGRPGALRTAAKLARLAASMAEGERIESVHLVAAQEEVGL